MPWPSWPNILRESSSHKEGGERRWSVSTRRFLGQNGHVSRLECVEVEWVPGKGGRMEPRELPGTEFEVAADLVLLALGFRRSGEKPDHRRAGHRERQGRKHPGRPPAHDEHPGAFCRRRHGAGPVARGPGHRRRPRSRQGHPAIPGRQDRVATQFQSQRPASTCAQKFFSDPATSRAAATAKLAPDGAQTIAVAAATLCRQRYPEKSLNRATRGVFANQNESLAKVESA